MEPGPAAAIKRVWLSLTCLSVSPRTWLPYIMAGEMPAVKIFETLVCPFLILRSLFFLAFAARHLLSHWEPFFMKSLFLPEEKSMPRLEAETVSGPANTPKLLRSF